MLLLQIPHGHPLTVGQLSKSPAPFSIPKQLALEGGDLTLSKVSVMEGTNNATPGQPELEQGQNSSQPVITGALGNPQFQYRTPGSGEQTPNTNVPFNLAQLSQFSPEQLQTVASFIQMLTGNPQQNAPPQPSGGTRKRPPALAGRNADGTPLRKMQSLGREGREMEKKIDRSDYEEEVLETEEVYYSEEEDRKSVV